MRVLKNELYRLMVTKSTWIVLSLLLVMTIAVAWMVSNGEKEKETGNWKEQLTVQNAQYEREMRELSPAVPKYQFLKEEIAVNQYRLEHKFAHKFLIDPEELLHSYHHSLQTNTCRGHWIR